MTTYEASEYRCSAGPMIMRMARTEANYERFFYRCPQGMDHPKSFIWVDEFTKIIKFSARSSFSSTSHDSCGRTNPNIVSSAYVGGSKT